MKSSVDALANGNRESSSEIEERESEIEDSPIGTFFIKGKWIPTDLLVSLIFRRIGYFAPPFFTEKECRTKFESYFDSIDASHIRSGFFFEGKRNSRFSGGLNS